jgi:tetratricopeptide (TPR) repeat protein
VELDPVSQQAHKNVAQAYVWARQFDEALRRTDKLVDLDPRFGPAYWLRWQIFSVTGRYEEALRALEKAKVLYEGELRGFFAYTWALAGRTEEARESLAGAIEASQLSPGVAYYVALMHTGLGDVDRAFEWWDRVFEMRNPKALLITHPFFDSLRGEPRYEALLRRLGLPE